jgi:hypothetical protein
MALPPERSLQEEFLFATLSNAAGTILAVAVLYLAGVAAGLFRARPKTLTRRFAPLGWSGMIPRLRGDGGGPEDLCQRSARVRGRLRGASKLHRNWSCRVLGQQRHDEGVRLIAESYTLVELEAHRRLSPADQL